jgi:hypothetical protein
LLVVVNYASAIELVIFPFSFVGYGAVGVVENSYSVHFVVFPLSVIVASLFVVKLASTVSHAIEFATFVAGPYTILLNNKLYFIFRIGSLLLIVLYAGSYSFRYILFDCLG